MTCFHTKLLLLLLIFHVLGSQNFWRLVWHVNNALYICLPLLITCSSIFWYLTEAKCIYFLFSNGFLLLLRKSSNMRYRLMLWSLTCRIVRSRSWSLRLLPLLKHRRLWLHLTLVVIGWMIREFLLFERLPLWFADWFSLMNNGWGLHSLRMLILRIWVFLLKQSERSRLFLSGLNLLVCVQILLKLLSWLYNALTCHVIYITLTFLMIRLLLLLLGILLLNLLLYPLGYVFNLCLYWGRKLRRRIR